MNNNENRRKRVNVDDIVAKQGLSGNQEDALANNLDKIGGDISIDLSEIHVAEQIRFTVKQSRIDNIVRTMPIINIPSVRTVNPEIDKDVPEGIKYIMLSGHHRLEAIRQSGVKNHKFRVVPRHLVDTPEKIIKHQFDENSTQTPMHILEKAHTFTKYWNLVKGKVTQTIAAEVFNIRQETVSRYLKLVRNFNKGDMLDIVNSDITSERVVLNIAKLKENDIGSWLDLFKEYALEKYGEADVSKINEADSIAILHKALGTEPKEPTPKQVETPVSEAPPTTQVETPVSEAPPTTQVETPVSEAPQTTQAATPVSEVPQTSNSTPPTSPVNQGVKGDYSTESMEAVANILQDVLMGKSVEDIVKDLGPEFKRSVTVKNGKEIFVLVNQIL